MDKLLLLLSWTSAGGTASAPSFGTASKASLAAHMHGESERLALEVVFQSLRTGMAEAGQPGTGFTVRGGWAAECPMFTTALAPSSKAWPWWGGGPSCKTRAGVQLSTLAVRHDGRQSEPLSTLAQDKAGLGSFITACQLASCADGAIWVLYCGTAVKTCKCESNWVPLLVWEKDPKGRTRGFLCCASCVVTGNSINRSVLQCKPSVT